jgi:preprotein translocase subunit SecB
MPENEAEQKAAQPQFALQRIYVKDISFESPNAPEVFQAAWKPQINMDLNTASNKVSDTQFEVTISLSITAKVDEKVAFIVEVQQAGIFHISGLEGPQLAQTLGAFCPNVLFPYAREAVDSMVNKGSFPSLMLAPVNFDAIFAEAMKRKQEEAEKAEGAATH